MRYYNLIISDAITGNTISNYSSLDSSGNTILGALNIELDIPIYQMATPAGNANLKVWGISLDDIDQAKNLNPGFVNGAYQVKAKVALYAGMAKGLPLANPSQSGLILQGDVNQAFGNWIDINQSLEFVVTTTSGTAEYPRNISYQRPQGTALGDMIKGTLAVAFPDFTCNVNTSENLILNQDEPGFNGNLVQFAQYVKSVSQHILGGDGKYQGVAITVKGTVINVYDGTVTSSGIEIAFTDLVGQPVWTGISTIQFKVILRADLNVGDYIIMPQTNTITTGQSYAQQRTQSIFQGNFQISQIRHVGNFRQPDGASWVTIIDAYRPVTNNG